MLSIVPHCCLIANTSLKDSVFQQSVVYLSERTPDEPIQGLIINQASPVNIDVLIEKFRLEGDIDLKESETPLLIGGPSNPSSVFFLNKTGSIDILTETQLRIDIKSGKLPDLFLGYSAWQPDSLTLDIQKGYWEVLSPTPGILKQPITKRYAWAQKKLGIRPGAFNSERPAHG